MTKIKIKIVRLIGAWLVLFAAFAIGMVACQKAADEIATIAENSVPESGQQGDYKNIESEEWEKRDYTDWEEAYPSSLLPAEDSLSVSQSGSVSVVQGADIPPSEASEIGSVVNSFLREWETFSPQSSDISERIEKYSIPGKADALASRNEAGGRWSVCAREERCSTGSRWLEETSAVVTIVAGGRDWVLAHALGTVRYSGPDPNLDGQISERRYGLLLRQIDGRWGVARAVATSGDIIIL